MALHHRVKVTAVTGLLLLGASEGAAQVARTQAAADTACILAMSARQVEVGTCHGVATRLVGPLTALLYRPSPRDVQSDITAAATAGSLAQAEPVPGIQPLGLAGASVAAVGADSGAKAIVALAVNPSIFFTSTGNSSEIARASRVADLTILFPADNLDSDDDGQVDYVGARMRFNLAGSKTGRDLIVDAEKAFREELRSDTRLTSQIEHLLAKAPDIGACYDALLDDQQDRASIAEQCGSQFVKELYEQQDEQLHQTLTDTRAKVDSKAYGLDLRLDLGDPTLGAVDSASGTRFDVGLVWGKQLLGQPTGSSLGVRLRGGAQYTDLTDLEETSFAFDGAGGFEARRPIQQGQVVTVSLGIEAHYGGSSTVEDELQTNYTVIRGSLAVPVAGGTGLVVAFGVPIDGPISPTLSVNFNSGLFYPKTSPSP